MALTNKGSTWERKNSLYLVFAFIPLLNCIPFFHMNSRIKNRKWSILGWIAILLQICIFFSLIIIPSVQYSLAPECPSYSDVGGFMPEAEEFMNQEQKSKYYEDSSYQSSTEFKLSSEYEEYQKAVEEYREKKIQWEQQPEIKAQMSEWQNFNNVITGLGWSIPVIAVIIYALLIIFAFNERPKYLKMLAQSENKTDFTERMSARQNTPQPFAYNHTQSSVQNTATVKIDINSASEEDFTSLTGITIIDAKKAIAYREEHGGFRTVDEFFTCINAKPHIIASIEKQLFVGAFETEKKAAVGNNGKRQLDL